MGRLLLLPTLAPHTCCSRRESPAFQFSFAPRFPSIHGSGGGADRADGVAPWTSLLLRAMSQQRTWVVLFLAVYAALSPALRHLVPTRLRPRLALRHLLRLHLDGAGLARRTLHMRHVRRRVQPALHGHRAHRRRPRHARFEVGQVHSVTGQAVSSILFAQVI